MIPSIKAIRKQLTDLEKTAYAGLIPTTDRDGKRAWLKHSGISTLRKILHAELQADKAGRELNMEDLSPELAEEIDLWSRAELPEDCGALAVMVRDEARRILGRLGG